jgi:hypothetical protein
MISKQKRANYSSIDKFECGCYIRKGKNENMFFEVFSMQLSSEQD